MYPHQQNPKAFVVDQLSIYNSTDQQETDEEIDEVQVCHSKCKHDRKEDTPDVPFIQCCLCTEWFHIDCVGIEAKGLKKIGFWPCLLCRNIVKDITVLQAAMKDIETLIKQVFDPSSKLMSILSVVNDENSPLKELMNKDNSLLREMVAMKSAECEKLKATNLDLQKRLDTNELLHNCDSSDESETEDESVPEVQGHGHLLIGDSLIRNVDPTTDDMVVGCMKGAKYTDVLKKLRKDTKHYKQITIVCGTNDLSTKMNIEKITDHLQEVLHVAKSKSEKVSLSSILPRLDQAVSESKLNSMNERSETLAQSLGVNFVNNDMNFKFLNAIPDESLLLPDGIHLTAAGVSRLLKNIGIDGFTRCNLPAKEVPKSPLHSSRTQDSAPKRLCTRSQNGVTLFYGKESVFSNLHMETPIYVDGKTYNCNEQYYTYMMANYFDDHDSMKLSMSTDDPYELVALQKKVKNFDRHVWAPEAERILYLANLAKYTQNAVARRALLNTKDDILGEGSFNKTWGIGGSISNSRFTDVRNWTGSNIMGKILMNIRQSLCEQPSSDYHSYNRSASTHHVDSHLKACWFCGETNHVSKNCRHGQKVRCNLCSSLGHKAKFCYEC